MMMMCSLRRTVIPFIAALSLTRLPHLAAFSTKSWARSTLDVHEWKTPPCRRRTLLLAEESRRNGSCSCRRGFINYYAAAAVVYGTIAVSPANSMPQQSSDANDRGVQPRPPNAKTPIDNNPSSQTLANEYKPTALEESISGFVSGSAVSTVKTLVKYPLDTATVRLQMPNTQYTIRNLPALFSGSFDGIVAPLVSNIPAGAVFFAVKDATKSALKGTMGSGLPKWASTSLAVGAALPPYWAIRNPSEVVKTRLQVGADGYFEGMSTPDAFRLALSKGNSTSDGIGELYQGYSENVLYGFPADIIKFVAYDTLTGGKGKKGVSPVDGAVCGALSTAFAQLLTTPLDVVRNRIMAEVATDDVSGDNADVDVGTGLSYIERLTKIVKEEGMRELFAGSSPRVAKAVLSGAIQFATYEETKQKMSQFFVKRQ